MRKELGRMNLICILIALAFLALAVRALIEVGRINRHANRQQIATDTLVTGASAARPSTGARGSPG